MAVEGHHCPDARPALPPSPSPGSALPRGSTCASLVKRGPSVEIRPENRQANSTHGIRGVTIDSASPAYNAAHAARVDGDLTGTADQILPWGACKWGFDENVTRAGAVVESCILSVKPEVARQRWKQPNF
jgi:hypothetical protein